MDAPCAYGSMKPDGYMPRIIDEQIKHLLQTFGGVEVRGPKWCGKTWSALAAAESVTYVDFPEIMPIVSADPHVALQGKHPHVIDEWQEVPAIWDYTRHAIDADASSQGSFLLTGSSTPAKDKIHHSGAGRIARVDTTTMTLWESGESTGNVSLAGLFNNTFSPTATEERGLCWLTERICRGGWPATLHASIENANEAVTQYLEALFEVSVPKKGGKPRTARRMAASLARNVATSATLKTIASDALQDDSPLSAESTVSFYLDLFKSLFFIDELPGWDAPIRSKSRLRIRSTASVRRFPWDQRSRRLPRLLDNRRPLPQLRKNA